MTPKEKSDALYEKAGNYNLQSVGFNKGSFSPIKAIDIALITVDEIYSLPNLKVGRFEGEEDIEMYYSYWEDVKKCLIKKGKRSN